MYSLFPVSIHFGTYEQYRPYVQNVMMMDDKEETAIALILYPNYSLYEVVALRLMKQGRDYIPQSVITAFTRRTEAEANALLDRLTAMSALEFFIMLDDERQVLKARH